MLQPTPQRVAEHAEIDAITQEWVAAGNDITICPPRVSALGYTVGDWSRMVRGLKVATAEEITAERDRRLLKAIRNNDIELIEKLVTKRFDKQIKLDIEGGRVDPATGKALPLNNGGEVG